MSGHIKVDYGQLGELEQKLSRVVSVMSTELEASATLATMVGDAGLAAKVIGFGQSWNKHRFEIRDNLEFLRDSVKNIHEQLESVDAHLASGLEPDAGGAGAASAPKAV